MRKFSTLPRRLHGFGSRHPRPDALTAAFRSLAHRLGRVSDRALGVELCDLGLNPFVLLVESSR